MPLFVVERELPGITTDTLTSSGLRLKTCCSEMTDEGQKVRWIRSFFLPQSSKTHCYFEGGSVADVEEVNRRARMPFDKVSEAVELSPEQV